jgi:hypothetical protein
MSTTFEFLQPGARRAAAPLLPSFTAAVRRAGLGVWTTLEAYGPARARRELLQMADRFAYSDPALSQEILRNVGEAPR